MAMMIEITVQTDRKEESIHLTDMEEESTAQDKEIDKTDMRTEQETGKNIHLMKTEGTQVTGEGDAKGP